VNTDVVSAEVFMKLKYNISMKPIAADCQHSVWYWVISCHVLTAEVII